MFETIAKYNFWDKKDSPDFFVRTFYTQKLLSYLNNSLIKVIIGQRRVGKSYIMRMLIGILINEKKINPVNILYINKDIYELDFIRDAKMLQAVIIEYINKLKPKGKIYIFIDEVQEIEEWEKIINSLSQDYANQYEVFITGSNSNLLSMELATYISGRYVQLEIFPFSYTEYLKYQNLDNNKINFVDYMKNGGMPENMHLNEYELKANYLEALKNSIILKDIIRRHNIRDASLLDRLVDFLIDSIGSMFSINKIVNYLTSQKYRTNHETISNYLKYIEETFFIHGIEKYEIKGKEILLNEKKYYLNDVSFKYFMNASFDLNISRYLENIIFIHLKRCGYQVFVGKIKDKEIDFIAEKNNEKIYLQVCYLLTDESAIEREFGNLSLISDHYEKMVISMDDVNFDNKNGIKHKNVWDFLWNE